MPLVALAVVAYAAGLLAGLGGALTSALVVAALLAAGCAVNRRWMHAALAVIGGAGAGVGGAARVSDERCAAVAAAAHEWTGVLLDDAAPGGYARAELGGGGCVVRAGLSVASGRAEAGRRVRVSGAASPAERGLRVRDATVAPAGGPTLAAARARADHAIDRVFGADAPLARALLVADMAAIPPEMRDRFADAGLVHVLSVSGLHVAIVAGAVQLLLVAARVPHRGAALGAAAATLAYVALLGAPPPALRSGVMLAAGTASRFTQRPTSPWASLALGALVPLLLDPRAAADLGFQLSVAGIVGLIASGAVARRAIAPRWSGWRAHVARELLTSIVASLVTLPLVAWAFGRVSVVAPVTNLAAGPVIAVLQPTLFLALALAPLPSLAHVVASAAHPMLWTLDAIAGAGAAVPGGSIAVWPSPWTAVALGVGAAAGVAAATTRYHEDRGRPLVVGAATLALVACWPPPRGSGELEMHVLDVGQGDAIALRTPRGRWVIVDAGRVWEGGDAGRATVVPYVRRRGGDVAAFVLSHPHADHVGGAESVLRSLRPAEYWDAGFAAASESYAASLQAATVVGTRWRRVHPGDETVLDGVRFRFLAPDSVEAASLPGPNDASTVVVAELGAVRFLLVGDAERGEEAWLLAHVADLRADVLKVGHHGSSTSSTPEFLDAVRPRVAVVSVGRGNTYGHPSGDVMRALANRRAEVFRTDQLGSVVVRTDGARITVHSSDTEWPLPPTVSTPPAPDR